MLQTVQNCNNKHQTNETLKGLPQHSAKHPETDRKRVVALPSQPQKNVWLQRLLDWRHLGGLESTVELRFASGLHPEIVFFCFPFRGVRGGEGGWLACVCLKIHALASNLIRDAATYTIAYAHCIPALIILNSSVTINYFKPLENTFLWW